MRIFWEIVFGALGLGARVPERKVFEVISL